ncbi:sulfate transporter, partial [Trifolium medium]|nr:sulfate transporter [Trifolium medium]
ERQTHREGVSAPRAEKESSAPSEGVRVGDIVVELGANKVRLAQNNVQKVGDVLPSKEVELLADTVKEGRVLMKSYRTKLDDAEWARNGIVATVHNGEAIPVVQNRIVDAGF